MHGTDDHDGTETGPAGDHEELRRLLHGLRQPLGTLVLLADNAQRMSDGSDLRMTLRRIEEQVDQAVEAARKIARALDVTAAATPRDGRDAHPLDEGRTPG